MISSKRQLRTTTSKAKDKYRIEGSERAIVDAVPTSEVPHMISDNINHQVHASPMKCSREIKQVLLGSEVAVQRVDILRPISVVSRPVGTVPIDVFDYR